ncbi:carbonic anhydrase [Aphanothece sacrum]|uniref:carbonic anhydrase n=1 Tax=Aphanothece sacrum FPU1 TaxID=1920663 RepID=A0A401INI5_APHSA|nr:carbonic anhydrase [Aphanothece sacrum]GBF82809.1 carbonate dehydratase [Aphanothece sacrum FPU1]GBF85956.1 carbonate dehydratase [Aphanothece sacrum FPU3]
MNSDSSKFDLSRRNLIKYGGGFIGTGLLAAAIGTEALTPSPVVAQNDMTPDQALAKLMEGNKRFTAMKSKNPNQDIVRLKEVAKGQKPFAAVLSCADSRVPIEIVFDQGLGDVFVCRDAGNIAIKEEVGSLEFGTLVLGAKILLVIGHESCGAIIAAMKGGNFPGSIGSFIDEIQPAITEFKGKQDDVNAVRKATEANVLHQVNILKRSPVLSDLIANNKLKIVGAYYDLDTGKITVVS